MLHSCKAPPQCIQAQPQCPRILPEMDLETLGTNPAAGVDVVLPRAWWQLGSVLLWKPLEQTSEQNPKQ